MKKIYIRFAGDNDFINTMRPFVQALAEKVFYTRWWEDITKELESRWLPGSARSQLRSCAD